MLFRSFDLLDVYRFDFVGFIGFDLGKNMKHEVHVLGKKKNNVLLKNNEKEKKNFKVFLKKLFRYLFFNFLR